LTHNDSFPILLPIKRELLPIQLICVLIGKDLIEVLKLDILIDSNELGRIIQANHLAVAGLLDMGAE